MDDHETVIVWVIGAGMSVGAGIPAMDGLTRLVLSERYMMGRRNAAQPGVEQEQPLARGVVLSTAV